MVLAEIGEAEDAFELLQETRAKFTEGFDSIDFAKSTEVLHSLSSRRPNAATERKRDRRLRPYLTALRRCRTVAAPSRRLIATATS